jgi:multidrug resistance efflux pump
MKANAFARAISWRPGRVAAVEAQIDGEVVHVRAEMNGVVERVLVAKGQLVEKDDLLVELGHRELDRRIALAAAALDLALAKSKARAPKTTLAARSRGGVSAPVELPASIEVHRARAAYMKARVNRLETEIRAPVAGRVLGRSVLAGAYVGVSEPLVSILERNTMWVLARFAPSEFACLRLGQQATVRVGGHTVSARVEGMVAQQDPVLVEFVGRPPDVALRPGMRAEVTVETS